MLKSIFLAIQIFLLSATAAFAQTIPGLPLAALGSCQLSASALGSAVGLSSCVRASFTSSAGTNSTQLVVTSVTGIIKVGDQIVSGTGLTAGTKITGQVSGTPGGAGTYQLSATNTASSASTTSGGIPPGATSVFMQSETADVRYRDDGGVPTASIGNIVVHGAGGQIFYSGNLSALQFIALSGSPLLDVAFYK